MTNPEGLFRDWLRGYCPAPSSFRGASVRLAGELRLKRALLCVDEEGQRLRPFPRTAVDGKRLANEIRAVAMRERRALLGVS